MDSLWKDVLCRTKIFVKQPERFLGDASEDFEKSKILLKVLYDSTKLTEGSISELKSLRTLPELIIDDFDEEQVWTAVELQNASIQNECQQKLQQLLFLRQQQPVFNLLNGHQIGQDEEQESDDEEDQNDLEQDSSSEDDDDVLPLPSRADNVVDDDEDLADEEVSFIEDEGEEVNSDFIK
jgi:hypothetical protein